MRTKHTSFLLFTSVFTHRVEISGTVSAHLKAWTCTVQPKETLRHINTPTSWEWLGTTVARCFREEERDCLDENPDSSYFEAFYFLTFFERGVGASKHMTSLLTKFWCTHHVHVFVKFITSKTFTICNVLILLWSAKKKKYFNLYQNSVQYIFHFFFLVVLKMQLRQI